MTDQTTPRPLSPVCCWMVDSVQIFLSVACGVGTDAVSQELLTFLHAMRADAADR